MYSKTAIAVLLAVAINANALTCGIPTYKRTNHYGGVAGGDVKCGGFENYSLAKMEAKCNATEGCNGFSHRDGKGFWCLKKSSVIGGNLMDHTMYSKVAAVPCPVDHIHDSFSASLLNADAWASYKAANSAHVSASKGLRLKRTEAVKAYFDAKTKAASAATALADATTA